MRTSARNSERRPYLGVFYGPHREEYARVAEQIARVIPAVAKDLRGGLNLTGPFSRPRDLDDDARWALGRAREVLYARLHEIAPDAFAPDLTLHDMPVIAGEPWIYLEWALGGKILAIAGHGSLAEAEVERMERPWRVIFG
jgi:hypothetical protein